MKSIIKDPLRPFLNPALASLLAGAIAIFASNSQASEDIIKAMQLAEDTKWYEVNIVIFKQCSNIVDRTEASLADKKVR